VLVPLHLHEPDKQTAFACVQSVQDDPQVPDGHAQTFPVHTFGDKHVEHAGYVRPHDPAVLAQLQVRFKQTLLMFVAAQLKQDDTVPQLVTVPVHVQTLELHTRGLAQLVQDPGLPQLVELLPHDGEGVVVGEVEENVVAVVTVVDAICTNVVVDTVVVVDVETGVVGVPVIEDAVTVSLVALVPCTGIVVINCAAIVLVDAVALVVVLVDEPTAEVDPAETAMHASP
jgi:hypothetical protein